MSGWFRTQRDIFKHPMWEDDPLSKREAWMWLIANAAWKDTRHKIGKHTLPVGAMEVFLFHLGSLLISGAGNLITRFEIYLEIL